MHVFFKDRIYIILNRSFFHETKMIKADITNSKLKMLYLLSDVNNKSPFCGLPVFK